MRRALLATLLVTVLGCSSSDTKPTGETDHAKPLDPQADPRDFLRAEPIAPWPKDGAGLKAGVWVERRIASDGKTVTRRTAVVGEAGPLLKVEKSLSDNSYLGFIEGLTVQRADGKVLEAIAAKKGEKAKPIKVDPASSETPPLAPPSGDEKITVAAGTFETTKTVTGELTTTTTWIGKDGDARGLVVKWSDDLAGDRELKTLAVEDATVAGRPLKAVHATYSDGSEEWWVRDLEVPFYAKLDMTLVKQVRAGTTMELAWGEDAKPEIDWGN